MSLAPVIDLAPARARGQRRLKRLPAPCCPVCAQLDALDGLGVVPTPTTRSPR